jgi:hypothetical protein
MTTNHEPATCPRCGSDTTSTVAQSPVPGRWTIISCTTCWYAWRSTEPRTATDPDSYPDDFRLVPAEIANLPRLLV